MKIVQVLRSLHMPNKYKIEYTVIDEYESIEDSPLSLEEIVAQFEPTKPPQGIKIDDFSIEKLYDN